MTPTKSSVSVSRPLNSICTLVLILLFILTMMPPRLFAIDSLSYKIGQMVMTGFIPGSDFEDTLYYDLEHRNLGGVILMAYNMDNPTQIANLTENLRSSASTPPFIATDQEGGVVARLDENNGYKKTTRALQLGNINHEDSTRAQASLMAEWMVNAGLNTNLAPVADVNVNPSSPAIGVYERSYSDDPDIVSDHINWFYSEFHDRNIVTALKHFPGHGSAVGDSHDGFTDVTNTWTRSELIPYTHMIGNDYSGMIMTGHLYNAKIDSAYPATLSKPTLTGILRDSLGFNGVIITDDMRMGAISNNYSFIESVTHAIDAGVDILLYVGNEKYGKSIVNQICKVVKTAIDSGMITEERIDESYDRIMALKSSSNTAITSYPPIMANRFELTAYPNPFNPSTTISISVDKDIRQRVMLNIYSIRGRLVDQQPLLFHGPGTYDIFWNASDMNGNILPSGTYIYMVSYDNNYSKGKLTLIK
jgi:beta-N-acetylhexosaminidase